MAAYTVRSSNAEASSCETLLHGVSAGGVTFFHVLPPSRVTWIRPSSVPAQSTFTSRFEGARAYTTPRRVACFRAASPYDATLAGTS